MEMDKDMEMVDDEDGDEDNGDGVHFEKEEVNDKTVGNRKSAMRTSSIRTATATARSTATSSTTTTMMTTTLAKGSGNDRLRAMMEILRKETEERSDVEVMELVRYLERFDILSKDVDQWTSAKTFKAFTAKTKYQVLSSGDYIYKKGDGAPFRMFFILKGSVTMEDGAQCTTLREHHVFGEEEVFTNNDRSTDCKAAAPTVHLAFWVRL